MASNKKRVIPTHICTGDMRHLVDIQTRSLDESDFDSSQPEETFTTERQQWCAIETTDGVSRFAKINIEDGATHIFWTPYDSGLPDIENRNTFISYDDKRYKVLKVTNVNERNEALAIQVTERGEDSEEATKA
jgi:SPP1 family predicted phage head-tail adaptor